MRSAGALFASIGAGAVLVGAVVAVVALFSFTFVFALGGFESADAAGSGEALVLDMASAGSDSARTTEATLSPVAVPPSSRRRAAARRSARGSDPVRANAASTTNATADTSQVAALGEGSTGQPPAAQQPAAPPAANAKPAPNLGDGVKQLGDGLSSAVQQTGTALANATAPLGEPVSAAVQQVLNIVAGLLKGTTDALGGALGARP